MAHRSVAAVVEGVQKMLEMNASFNLYMFHGGSNWGFMNGANAGLLLWLLLAGGRLFCI